MTDTTNPHEPNIVFAFATDIERAEYLINNVKFCDITTRDIDDTHVSVTFEIELNNINIAIQSIFHCGITYGVDEIKKVIFK